MTHALYQIKNSTLSSVALEIGVFATNFINSYNFRFPVDGVHEVGCRWPVKIQCAAC